MKKFISLILLSALFLLGLFLYQYLAFSAQFTRIVFCDVGASSAILITSANKTILIDAGPDQSILKCLDNHLPFWQKSLDLVILTNPDSDYFTGLYFVSERYIIKSFVIQKLANPPSGFKQLLKTIISKKIPVRQISTTQVIKLPRNLNLNILSPASVSPARPSLIIKLVSANFSALFTGRSQASSLKNISPTLKDHISLLQVPDQGSSDSLNSEIISLLQPKLAVISVGLNNTSSLPKDKILSILNKSRLKTLRTDLHGDIEVIVEPKRWFIK